MFENMKKLLKKDLSKADLIQFVLDRPEHQWMSEDAYTKANILDFLERLPTRVLSKVFYYKMTILVPSTGKYACAIASHHQNVIIVFPQVHNLLTKTYDGWAKAVLAHEIGHVYLDHSKFSEDPMEAQVDADQFACDMGYMEELESFLHEQIESVEKRVRLSFITSYYFANN